MVIDWLLIVLIVHTLSGIFPPSSIADH